jgi:hypothetical protein
LFDVVHEINANRLRRTCVQCRKDAGLTVRVDDDGFVESGVARQLRHVFCASRIVAIFGRNRRQGDPIAQSLNCFIMPLADLSPNVRQLFIGSVGVV